MNESGNSNHTQYLKTISFNAAGMYMCCLYLALAFEYSKLKLYSINKPVHVAAQEQDDLRSCTYKCRRLGRSSFSKLELLPMSLNIRQAK